jgi:hypothetical protein
MQDTNWNDEIEWNKYLEKCRKAIEVQEMIPKKMTSRLCDGWNIYYNVGSSHHNYGRIEPVVKGMEGNPIILPSQKELQTLIMKVQGISINELTYAFHQYLNDIFYSEDPGDTMIDILECIPDDSLDLDELWLEFTYKFLFMKVWNPEEKKWMVKSW